MHTEEEACTEQTLKLDSMLLEKGLRPAEGFQLGHQLPQQLMSSADIPFLNVTISAKYLP